MKHPLALAALTCSLAGFAVLGLAGGLEAVLGPSLAAVVATLFVLLGR